MHDTAVKAEAAHCNFAVLPPAAAAGEAGVEQRKAVAALALKACCSMLNVRVLRRAATQQTIQVVHQLCSKQVQAMASVLLACLPFKHLCAACAGKETMSGSQPKRMALWHQQSAEVYMSSSFMTKQGFWTMLSAKLHADARVASKRLCPIVSSADNGNRWKPLWQMTPLLGWSRKSRSCN